MKDAKRHKYLNCNVLEAAKARIRTLLDEFDSAAVAFSGGKDSLVALHLLREVQLESGHKGPTDCYFLDEELIPDSVIDFVRGYFDDSENWRLRWVAVPLASHKFILGKTYDYVQWDTGREWTRPKPEWATVTEADGVVDQYTAQALAIGDLPGRVVALNGMRADESLQRWSAIQSSRNRALPYLDVAPRSGRIWQAKPIYDWSEADVFRFMYDRGIHYCPVYDQQVWNGEELRVSTPLHAERAKRLNRLKTCDPVLWDRVAKVFPEVRVQATYWDEYDRDAEIESYPHSWAGIIAYVRDNITDPGQRVLALRRVTDAKAERARLISRYPDAFGGFPLLHVFRQVAQGKFKRRLQPLRAASVTKAMREYEKS